MSNSEGTPAIKGLSPGKRLLQGRLQLGLTQEQVAKELYITLTKVKALESDDYGRINTDTFIRGYIRAYANLLKLDVVEILAAYDQLQQEKDDQLAAVAAETKVEPQAAPRANKGSLPFLMVIGGLLVGLWLVSVWFFDNQQESNYSSLEQASSSVWSSSEAVAVSSAAELAAPAADPALAAVEVAEASSRKSSSLSSAVRYSSSAFSAVAGNPVQASSVAVASSASASAAQAAKSNALDTVVFTFRAECWLEVSDSRGDVLATELQAPGSKMTLVGKAPFDVKLGNAPAVDIELNGKKIDVIPLLGSNVLTMRISN